MLVTFIIYICASLAFHASSNLASTIETNELVLNQLSESATDTNLCPTPKLKLVHNPFDSVVLLPDLKTTILAASFLKKKLPLENQYCKKIGEKDAQMLNIIIRIANNGKADYVVNPLELVENKCSKQKSLGLFYSISIGNLNILQSEHSIQDTISPLKYTVAQQQGISIGNHQISQLSIDVTSANLIQGKVYDITVTVLPCDPDLKSKSDVYHLNYSPERRRTLRNHHKHA